MLGFGTSNSGKPSVSPIVRQDLYCGRELGNLCQTLKRIHSADFLHLIRLSDSRSVPEGSSALISPIFGLPFIRKAHGLDNSTRHWHCHSRISGQSSSYPLSLFSHIA